MWIFGRKRKAANEYVSAYIKIEYVRVGDYMVDVNSLGYEEVTIGGTLYEYDIYQGVSNPQSAEERIEVKVQVAGSVLDKSSGISHGFLSLAPVGHDYTYCNLFLWRPAINQLVNELRRQDPKFLQLLGRRDKGTQKEFDIYRLFLSKNEKGMLQFD
jgi:hypothetical protein